MAEKTERQYVLWDSPITARRLAEERRLEGVAWDSDAETNVWLEGRSGQGVLVQQNSDADAPCDLTSDLSVRAEVGYGGGDFTVADGSVYFSVHKTGRIYRQPLASGTAQPITPSFGSACSPTVSPDGRWVAYVHHDGEDNDRIAVVDSEGNQWPQIFATGHDFYMQPRWSPDGAQFCWIAWNHPHMPWDGTTLFTADVLSSDGAMPQLGEPQPIAGGADIAIFQPEFTADGRRLLFVSDETGWGRIASYDLQSRERQWLTPNGLEHALPAWRQGMRTCAVSHAGRHVIAARNERGFQRFWRISLDTGESAPIATLENYSEITDLAAAPAGNRFVFIGSGTTQPP